uniref:Uncharacterized protein n=1 Tax=Clytia hemisphaerica TaxID=252671 RepID=A0A7M5WUN1_9CNID|eukprot:TCONS_00071893-protein
MNVNAFSIALLLHYLSETNVVDCQRPSVSLLLHPDRNWSSIGCPSSVTNHDSQTDHFKDNNVRFICRLVERDKQIVDYPYHFTLFMMVDSKSILNYGCQTIGHCFSISITQPGTDQIQIEIKTFKECFTGRIPFRFELRQINTLISAGTLNVIFARQVVVPLRLNFRLNQSMPIALDGNVDIQCAEDFKTSVYEMVYSVRGKPECQTSNFTVCQKFQHGKDVFSISCPLDTVCDSDIMCSAIITAQIFTYNKFGQMSKPSRKFSKSLAFLTSRGEIDLNITGQTLNTMTFSFQRPVSCTEVHQHFQYRIIYKNADSDDEKWTNFKGETCISNDAGNKESTDSGHCSVLLNSLHMNTMYNICLSYRNIFDIQERYSALICQNSSTAQLPCTPPRLTKILPIEDNADNNHWKANLYWTQVEPDCWNDKYDSNSTHHYYLIELYDGNQTQEIAVPSFQNYSIDILTRLRYKHKYMVLLSACNVYGCINGPKSYMYVLKEKEGDTGHQSSQTLTETVLICVLSLLFLTASSCLYWILKKRKQFQRFQTMKRKLKPEDIKVVRPDCEMVDLTTGKLTPRGGVVAEEGALASKIHPDDRRIITVDTRPLLSRKISIVNSGVVPANSTLV